MRKTREPITIQVELEVVSYRNYREENLVQAWSYVGDYEISVWLPRIDERARKILKSR